MGGGSSDAASNLIALNRLWGWETNGVRYLNVLALTLGADVPFFLRGQNAWVEELVRQSARFETDEQPPAAASLWWSSSQRDWRQKFSSELLKRDSDHATILGFAAAHYDFGRNDLQPVLKVCAPR